MTELRGKVALISVDQAIGQFGRIDFLITTAEIMNVMSFVESEAVCQAEDASP